MSDIKRETFTDEQLQDRIDHAADFTNKEKVKLAKVWWREQPAEDRIHNTTEVPFRLSELEARAESIRPSESSRYPNRSNGSTTPVCSGPRLSSTISSD